MPGERLGGCDSSFCIHLRDIAELGQRDIVDLHAGARQTAECRLDTRGDLALRIVPDQRPSDEKAQPRGGHRDGQVARQPGHYCIEHGAALDRACDGTDGIQCAGQRIDTTPRDPLRRRLESDQATERGWDPNRATGVAADARHAHSVRHRHGGTRRRSPGNAGAGPIEGVAGRSEMRVETDTRVGELSHVGLANEDRTRAAQQADDFGIDRRRGRIGEHARTGGRDLAGDVEEIFDADRNSAERRRPSTGSVPRVPYFRFTKRGRIVPSNEDPRPLAGRVPGTRQGGRHQLAGTGRPPRQCRPCRRNRRQQCATLVFSSVHVRP